MSQSRIDRYKQAGCIFAEDIGDTNPNITYTNTEIVSSPYGTARRFDGSSKITLDADIDIGRKLELTITSHMSIKTVQDTYIVSMGGIFDPIGSFGWAYQESDSHLYFSISDQLLVSALVTIETDKYFTLSVTYDQSSVKYYFNGMQMADLPAVSVIIPNSGVKMSIGDLFDGDIADMVIDDRAWSSQELLDYHNNATFDHITSNCFPNYNIDGTPLEFIGNDEIINISQNYRSDGISSMGLTELQVKDFIHQYGRGIYDDDGDT